MLKIIRSLPFLIIAGAAMPATAQELRPFCTTRPSLGVGSCIVDVGHAMLEVGLADWQRQTDAGERTDTLIGSDLLMRVGVTPRTEVQLGWTAIGQERVRDRTGRSRRTRTGDVRIAVRRSLASPDGSGFSLAVQPFFIAPVGRPPIGGESWIAGAVVPVGYQLSDSVQVQFTGEIDATPDGDGAGRHPAYSGIGGVAVALSDNVTTNAELFVERDRDPAGGTTTVLAALSSAYQVTEKFQIDGGSVFGLNAQSADIRIFVGFSRRF